MLKPQLDQGRPNCQRCQKGFFVCGGYSTDSEVHSPADAKDDKGRSESNSRNLVIFSSSANFSFSSTTAADSRSQCQAVSLPPTLSLQGFKEDIVFAHLQQKMFLEYPETPAGELDGVNPWFSYLRQLFTHSNRLSGAYLSALAVAVGFFARLHKDPSLQRDGDRIYGQALRRVMGDVVQNTHPIDSCSASTGPLCLCVYELVRASGPVGWAQHSSGIAALTEMMGPYAFQDEAANAVFHLCRGFIIMGSVVRRKRCFLEQSKWKTIPFELQKSPRPISSRMQDIKCDMPGFLEDVLALETLRQNGDTISADRSAAVLSSKVIGAIEQLCDLRWEWEDENPGVCYEVVTRPGTTLCVDDFGEPLFQKVLFFQRMDRAMEILNFDAQFLVLYSILSLTGTDPLSVMTEKKKMPSDLSLGILSPVFGPVRLTRSTTTNALVNPGQWNSLDDLAIEICRLVDYFLFEKYDGLGAFTLLFPLRVAYKTLRHDQRIACWLRRMFQDIADSRGFEIGMHMLKQKDESSPLVL